MDAVSVYEVFVAVPPTNNLGDVPVINEALPVAPSSMLGLSGSVRTVDEAPLLHVGSPYTTHILNPGTSFPLSRTIFAN
jgi:hypothetical protein